LALALSASSGTLWRQMRLSVIALILPAAIVLFIAAFETSVFYPPPLNAPAQGIVWHGHTFTARNDFARWLRSRGVRYTVWARRHQAFLQSRRRSRAQYAAGVRAKKSFDGSAVRIGGGLAVLVSLGLVGVLLRSRRPGSASAGQPFRLAARRAAPVARRGTSSAKLISRRGTEIARSFAHRAAPAAKGGARLMLGLATAAALLSSSLAVSSAETIRRRRGEFSWYFASALLATCFGVLATMLLNRG
jgi:hypothetical protein